MVETRYGAVRGFARLLSLLFCHQAQFSECLPPKEKRRKLRIHFSSKKRYYIRDQPG